MQRRMARLIASALAAAGIAGGGALVTALASSNGVPTTAQLWLAGVLAIVSLCKDVQSSLSEPPRVDAAFIKGL